MKWSVMGSNIESPNLMLQGFVHIGIRHSNIGQACFASTESWMTKDGDTNYVHDFKGTQGRINQQRKALWFYGIWGKV
jgi:hypothetical protein